MNKTIKEQAQKYYEDFINMKYTDKPIIEFIEHIITEERKRRLPTKEEAMKKYKEFCDRDESGRLEDVADLYDYLLSYESEAVVEDEVKVGSKVDIQAMETKSWRNELAEKIMIATCTRNSLQGAETIVQDVFRLADEFIKQAKS